MTAKKIQIFAWIIIAIMVVAIVGIASDTNQTDAGAGYFFAGLLIAFSVAVLVYVNETQKNTGELDATITSLRQDLEKLDRRRGRNALATGQPAASDSDFLTP